MSTVSESGVFDSVEFEPAAFEKVEFEVDALHDVLLDVASKVPGLPAGLTLVVRIDDNKQTTRVSVSSLDPVTLEIESGALEDMSTPRKLGVDASSATFARLLFEVADRSDPTFGAPEVGDEIGLADRVSWDVLCYGRASRLGYRIHKPKHVYNFRNRHGFTDAADAAFEALWQGEVGSWGEIVELSPVSASD